MITSNELELRSTLTLGTLESNAKDIQALVLAKLQDYTPENYIDKVAEAKADRAVLNNAEKALNAKRLELEREYNKPFAVFKQIVAETCMEIKRASAALDAIVKAEEQREKDEKRAAIQQMWNDTGFSLFPLEKVFNDKWLNKSAKEKDILQEIKDLQKKTFDDLEIIGKFAADNVPLLKTVYLDTLSISDAMQKAKQLQDNRDRLAREKVECEAMAKAEQLKAQAAEERQEIQEDILRDNCDMNNMVAQALGLEVEEEAGEKAETFALVFHGTHNSLLTLKRFMTENGITYEKLADKGSGVYAVEKVLSPAVGVA